METVQNYFQTAETTCNCSFCNKDIKQNEKFVPFDVHALVGAQVCKQKWTGLEWKQDSTKISFFSPIAKRKAFLCNDCFEKNKNRDVANNSCNINYIIEFKLCDGLVSDYK